MPSRTSSAHRYGEVSLAIGHVDFGPINEVPFAQNNAARASEVRKVHFGDIRTDTGEIGETTDDVDDTRADGLFTGVQRERQISSERIDIDSDDLGRRAAHSEIGFVSIRIDDTDAGSVLTRIQGKRGNADHRREIDLDDDARAWAAVIIGAYVCELRQ